MQRKTIYKNVNVKFPIGLFNVVTGVSGSGKSTLINEILYKGLANQLYRSNHKVGAHKEIRGLEHIDKIINIDQSPIGRTPRSNPATIQVYLMLYASSIVKHRKQRCVVTNKGALALT